MGANISFSAPVPKSRRYLSTISFSLTHRCDIACAHCMPSSGPTRRGDMDSVAIDRWITEAAALAPHVRIAFTGGEPFLNRKALRAGEAACRKHGLTATVITNARWARTQSHAETVLAGIPAVRTVGLSVDRHHLAFVDPAHISNLVAACRVLGRRSLLRITYGADRDGDVAAVRAAIGDDLLGVDIIEAQPMIRIGRAAEQFREEDCFDFADAEVPCLMADEPAVDVDGRMFACCGPSMLLGRSSPLYLGDWTAEPLSDIVKRARRRPLLQAIRWRGPSAILRELGERPRPGHMCANCIHLCRAGPTAEAFRAAAQDTVWIRRLAVETGLGEGDLGLLD